MICSLLLDKINMSFIHTSPLFHPLEPLPVMSPTVMRSGKKRTKSNYSTGSTSTPTTSASDKVKNSGGSPRVSHPLANTALVMPVQNPAPQFTIPDMTQDDVTKLIAASMADQHRPSISQHASYEEDSLDSQEQGSLMFTLESQPMSDLSSSQQMS